MLVASIGSISTTQPKRLYSFGWRDASKRSSKAGQLKNAALRRPQRA